MDKDLIEEMGQELLACAATIEKATAALGVMEDLASELAATKKTLGTLIVWLQLDLGSENVERLLAMMSSSQREAAGTADEKSDGQAEKAIKSMRPPSPTPNQIATPCGSHAMSCSGFFLAGWQRAFDAEKDKTEEYCGRQTCTWKCAGIAIRLHHATNRHNQHQNDQETNRR